VVKRFEDFLRGRHDWKSGTKVVYVGAVKAFNKVLAELGVARSVAGFEDVFLDCDVVDQVLDVLAGRYNDSTWNRNLVCYKRRARE